MGANQPPLFYALLPAMRGLREIARRLRETEESDLLLCAAAESLCLGAYLIYPPASLILSGLILAGLAYLSAAQGVTHGVA